MTEAELRSITERSRDEGFRAIVMQYNKYVFSIVWKHLRYIGTIEDAKECMSDVFAHVFMNFDEINEGTLQGYIAVIAERKAVDRYRSLRSEHADLVSGDEADNISDGTNLQDDIETAERNRMILDRICSLGEPDAELLIRKYYYGQNAADIAKITGLSHDNVRKRISRAINKLRQLLTDANIY